MDDKLITENADGISGNDDLDPRAKGLLMEAVGHSNFFSMCEYLHGQGRKQEISVTNETKNKAEDATPREQSKALESKKRKTEKQNMGEGEIASPSVIIPKRMRPSAPDLQAR